MSITSMLEHDDSAALAKRFARLTSVYLEQPSEARTEEAQVPLENLYRMLEMFRYDSFDDESRHGVLAIEGVETYVSTLESKNWHVAIYDALKAAFQRVYGHTSKAEAIDELESALRDLSKGNVIPAERQLHAQEFFNEFQVRI